jgi:hypothetical protein
MIPVKKRLFLTVFNEYNVAKFKLGRVKMSAEDSEIIDKIKKYAKEKGKKFLDDDFCKLKGLSHSKFYRKKKSVESFIDFECIEKMYRVLSRDILEVRHSYLKDYFKHVLLPEQKDKILEHYQHRIDCLSFITTSSPILFISMYSSQLSENIEDILNASTHQNSILKELNICVNEINDNDYENRDVIFNKIRRWRDVTENQLSDAYIRLIFRNYNVPSTVAGVVDSKVISYVQDGEQFLKLSDVGQKLIVDDVIQMMSPRFSEYLVLGSDTLDYDDVNNVDNPAMKLTDFDFAREEKRYDSIENR